MRAPRVSFLMPVAAPAPYLGEALVSLVDQTFDSWEVVVVNDGGDPDIAETARSLVPTTRLVLVERSERQGIARALNAGLAAVTGDLVARIDADDRCRAERLEAQVRVMDREPELVLLGCGARLIDSDGLHVGERRPTSSEDVRRRLLRRNQFVHSSVVFRRELVVQVGGYDPACHLREDYELWLRLAAIGQVANLDGVLVDYRLSPGQLSAGLPTPESLRIVGESQTRLAEALGVSPARARLQHLLWRQGQTGAGRRTVAALRSRGRKRAAR